jgi:hypothetical protein
MPFSPLGRLSDAKLLLPLGLSVWPRVVATDAELAAFVTARAGEDSAFQEELGPSCFDSEETGVEGDWPPLLLLLLFGCCGVARAFLLADAPLLFGLPALPLLSVPFPSLPSPLAPVDNLRRRFPVEETDTVAAIKSSLRCCCCCCCW